MLSAKYKVRKTGRAFFTLLIFISFITFQNIVSAGEGALKIALEYRDKGYAEHQKGNLNEALTYYSKALSLGLETPVLLNDLGILYEEIGITGRAESYYLRAIQIDESYLPSYLNLAYLYLQSGSPDKAKKYFLLRFEKGQADDLWAKKALEELLRIDPSYKIKAVQLEAKKLNEEVVQQARKEFYERIRKANEHFLQGQALANRGEYLTAIQEFDRALTLTPQNPKVLKARKKAVLELTKKNVKERSEQAIKMLEEGDSNSAKYEIQKMLTTIPNESVLNSR